MRKTLILVLGLLLIGRVAFAEETSVDTELRWEILNVLTKASEGTKLENGGVLETRVVVEGLSEYAKKTGLSEESIQNCVELQLRKNGIKPVANPSVVFYVNVNVVGSAFNVCVSYKRLVFYLDAFKKLYYTVADVWHRNSTGIHGGDSGYILEAVREQVDMFSNGFLKANGK